jgi:hypothetical protein
MFDDVPGRVWPSEALCGLAHEDESPRSRLELCDGLSQTVAIEGPGIEPAGGAGLF